MLTVVSAAYDYMEKNKEYIGEVLSLGSEGEGVIKIGDETAFVPFCLAGERVSFKVLKSSGSVSYGKLTEVHTLSKERVAAVCPHFEKCGGCQLQHASYSEQLSFKRDLVKNCLKKIGGIDFEVSSAVPSEREYGYRNKLALPVGVDDGGRNIAGFYAPRSHRIVPVKSCALQPEWSGFVISALLTFMREQNLKGYDERTRRGEVRQIVVRELDGKQIITVVSAKVISLKPLAALLDEKFKKYTLLLNVNTSSGNAVFGKEWHICRGEGFFMGETCGVKFKAGANTFLQVNDWVRNKLYSKIVDEVKDEHGVAIDLYSGGGTLTAMLAGVCKAAYGVEIVKEAVECADELKDLNGLQEKMFNYCGAVEDKISDVLELCEGEKKTIICDPPRKGMERSVVKAVLASGAEKVILVSCNPATLARDLGLLCGSLREEDGQLVKNYGYSEKGLNGFYKIESITPYDMFPQTKHVETLLVLKKL